MAARVSASVGARSPVGYAIACASKTAAPKRLIDTNIGGYPTRIDRRR
jgi:hypothetical protein